MFKLHIKRCLICLVAGIAIGCYGTIRGYQEIKTNPGFFLLRSML